jgi:uncharacterized membrane protein YjfL (UPF0719 family)
MTDLGPNLLAAVIYAALGVTLFLAAFAIFDRVTPGSLWKEIIEEHNTALAILMGGVAMGLSVIVAAAIW